MIASYFLVSASVRAAEGISNAPGTRTMLIWLPFAPERSNPSYALCRSRSVMKALNLDTTIAKRLPAALSPPSRARSLGSAESSEAEPLLAFLSVALCLRGKNFS